MFVEFKEVFRYRGAPQGEGMAVSININNIFTVHESIIGNTTWTCLNYEPSNGGGIWLKMSKLEFFQILKYNGYEKKFDGLLKNE